MVFITQFSVNYFQESTAISYAQVNLAHPPQWRGRLGQGCIYNQFSPSGPGLGHSGGIRGDKVVGVEV